LYTSIHCIGDGYTRSLSATLPLARDSACRIVLYYEFCGEANMMNRYRVFTLQTRRDAIESSRALCKYHARQPGRLVAFATVPSIAIKTVTSCIIGRPRTSYTIWKRKMSFLILQVITRVKTSTH